MNLLVSVIIPIYNSEKYLDKCIESVLNQTYTNLEILLIDDGSKDKSAEMCDTYSKKDKRIKVIHKNNEGVSKARNFGIDHSNGKYVLFIDSDDIIEKDYIKILYDNIKEKDADISMCNIIRVNEDMNMIDKFDIDRKNNKPKTITMNKEEFISNILDYKYYFTYATNKLIKKDIIGDTRFRNDIHYNEDGLFFLDLSKKINKVVFTYPVYLYYYIQNTGSANAQKFNERHLSIIKSFEIMEKYFAIFNYNNKCYYAYRYINYLIEGNYFLYLNKKIKKIKNQQYKEVIKKYFKYGRNSDNISKLNKYKFILKVYFPKIVMGLKYINN